MGRGTKPEVMRRVVELRHLDTVMSVVAAALTARRIGRPQSRSSEIARSSAKPKECSTPCAWEGPKFFSDSQRTLLLQQIGLPLDVLLREVRQPKERRVACATTVCLVRRTGQFAVHVSVVCRSGQHSHPEVK